MTNSKLLSFFLGAPLLLAPTTSCLAQSASDMKVPVVSVDPARGIYVAADAADGGDGTKEKPLADLQAAFTMAQPGDGVVLRGGTYRGNFRLPSGEEGRPITVMAHEGERAILSGFASVEGWKPFRDNIQVTTIAEKPDGLFVGRKLQPMSQEPNEGWFRLEDTQAAEDGKTMVLTDERLSKYPDLQGGHFIIWTKIGNAFGSGAILSQDGKNVTIDKSRWMRAGANDPYQLKNHVSLIDRPGEWAFEENGEGVYTVYFWPLQESDLENTQTRAWAKPILEGYGVHHVIVHGLEVTGSQGYGIYLGRGASDVHVSRCIVDANALAGIQLRGITGSSITHCIVVNNGNGIGVASARNILLEANEVAFNEVDGIVITGDISGNYGKPAGNPDDTTENVTARRNYVHHHLLAGHPDNFQMYRGVRDVRLIENLALSGGQGLMTEDVDGGELTGNVFIGSDGNLMIFGHSNSNDWKIKNNVFAAPGYSIFSFTGKNYEGEGNVYFGGFSKLSDEYQGDRNLFTEVPRGVKFEKYETLEEFQTETEVEGNSTLVSGSPFRGAPKSSSAGERVAESTREMLFLRNGEGFEVGDLIEVNSDGVARKVTALETVEYSDGQKDRTSTQMTFTPALSGTPVRTVLVYNWGEQGDLKYDLRLASETNTKDLGSPIDVEAFRRGDFSGDGQRDIPELPADVQAALPDPNAVMTPMF